MTYPEGCEFEEEAELPENLIFQIANATIAIPITRQGTITMAAMTPAERLFFDELPLAAAAELPEVGEPVAPVVADLVVVAVVGGLVVSGGGGGTVQAGTIRGLSKFVISAKGTSHAESAK